METRRSTETSPSATAPVPSSPSLRARLALTAGRYGIRPINCLLPANPLGIAAARGLVASIMALCGPVLPGTRVTQVRSGSPCELEVWPGQIHVFQALPLAVPEAGAALRRAAAFVTGVLARPRAAQPVSSAREAG